MSAMNLSQLRIFLAEPSSTNTSNPANCHILATTLRGEFATMDATTAPMVVDTYTTLLSTAPAYALNTDTTYEAAIKEASAGADALAVAFDTRKEDAAFVAAVDRFIVNVPIVIFAESAHDLAIRRMNYDGPRFLEAAPALVTLWTKVPYGLASIFQSAFSTWGAGWCQRLCACCYTAADYFFQKSDDEEEMAALDVLRNTLLTMLAQSAAQSSSKESQGVAVGINPYVAAAIVAVSQDPTRIAQRDQLLVNLARQILHGAQQMPGIPWISAV